MRKNLATYLEAPDGGCLASVTQLVVDPLHDLLLDDGVAGVGQPRQYGQRVRAHQLPDQRWNIHEGSV